MDQREKRYGKDDRLRKRNRTVQRNIETEKKQQGIESTKIAIETRKEEDAHGI
jgi:hypothetical protein